MIRSYLMADSLASSNWLAAQVQTAALSAAMTANYNKVRDLNKAASGQSFPIWTSRYQAENPTGQGNSDNTGSYGPGSFKTTGTPPNYS